MWNVNCQSHMVNALNTYRGKKKFWLTCSFQELPPLQHKHVQKHVQKHIIITDPEGLLSRKPAAHHLYIYKHLPKTTKSLLRQTDWEKNLQPTKKLKGYSCSFCPSPRVPNICKAEHFPLIVQNKEYWHKMHSSDWDSTPSSLPSPRLRNSNEPGHFCIL